MRNKSSGLINLPAAKTLVTELGLIFCLIVPVYAADLRPEVQAPTYVEKRLRNVIKPIRFPLGKAEISGTELQILNRVLLQLKGKHNLRVEVVGHSDNVRVSKLETLRKYKDNQGLSLARAQQVADFLSEQLVFSSDRITVMGKGALEPIANNATPAGRAANRRVEVLVAYDELASYKAFDFWVEDYSEAGLDLIKAAKQLNQSIWISQAPATRNPRFALQAQERILFAKNRLYKPLEVYIDSNFPDFIDHWQLEIYASDDIGANQPLAIIDGDGAPVIGQPIRWFGKETSRPLANVNGLRYRMKLTDIEGRQAVTRFLVTDLVSDLRLVNVDDYKANPGDGPIEEESWYERLKERNDLEENRFNLPGGLVTINANDLPPGGSFHLGNDIYPVAADGVLRIERQLAPGDYSIPVAVFDANDNPIAQQYLNATVSGDYFFMVGLADLTVGDNKINGSLELVDDETRFDDSVFVDGRLAFYLKGKIKGKYLLTAQLDTGEDDIEEIFRDLGRRDPRRLFKRIDPDRYYPVYGDGSSITRDVDTQGKFYVRLDWDQSTLLWGNYNTSFSGTELAGFNRGLYGAKIDLRSGQVTEYGDEKSSLKVFAAEPDSASAHDELEGTGGSLYYLSHQDLVLGSAKISVEVRERDSRRIRQKTDLIEGRDYEIDEFQGRIILRRPLTSGAAKSLLSIIRDEPLEGDTVLLVVDYEFIPQVSGDDNRLTAGIRGKHWLNKFVGLGATYLQEENGDLDYENIAVDLTLKASRNTYVSIEFAQTTAAQNIAFNQSIDGGLSYVDQQIDVPTVDADAVSVNARLDLADVSDNRITGSVGAWYRDYDTGFNSLQYNNANAGKKINYGLEGTVKATDKLGLSWRYSSDEFSANKNEKIGLQTDYQVNDSVTISGEYQHRESTLATNNEDSDSDIAALRVQYQYDERLGWIASAQQQINGDDEEFGNLYGVGFDFRANTKLNVSGEYFTGEDGNKGDGVRVGADYKLNDDGNVYLNYTSNRQSSSQQAITLGHRGQVTDKLSVYQEHRFDVNNSDRQRGNSYGINYQISPGWSWDLEIFNGATDRSGTSYDRQAYSVTSRWKNPDFELVNRFEFRDDENATSKTQQWVTANRFAMTINQQWSLLGKIDYSVTEDESSEARLARFAEVDMGFAYRPIFDDRLNLLGMYAYLYDLDPLQQFGSSQFDERSHVVSLEAIYELNDLFELGGKLAYKRSELRISRDQGDFYDSSTSLGIIRLRYHLLNTWDALGEYRRLDVIDAGDVRQGYLAAVERHLGNNIKLGLGYNFTDFNDDLTALDFDSQGWFINILYKQ